MRPLFFAVCILFSVQAVADSPPQRQMELARQHELVRLVRHDCGSCHGLTLMGGLGPALLPANLRDKPKESLVATILFGRPGTPMPPWREFVTEQEAEWIVDRLIEDFPSEP